MAPMRWRMLGGWRAEFVDHAVSCEVWLACGVRVCPAVQRATDLIGPQPLKACTSTASRCGASAPRAADQRSNRRLQKPLRDQELVETAVEKRRFKVPAFCRARMTHPPRTARLGDCADPVIGGQLTGGWLILANWGAATLGALLSTLNSSNILCTVSFLHVWRAYGGSQQRRAGQGHCWVISRLCFAGAWLFHEPARAPVGPG